MRGLLHKIIVTFHHMQTLLVIVVSVLFMHPVAMVYAARLENRSIEVSTALPSAVARHSFSMTPESVTPIGSIAFEYCANSPLIELPCAVPAGLDVSSASMSSESGNTGFSIDGTNTTSNRIVLSRPPVAAFSVSSSYVFDNIVNPSIPAETIFVRMLTYGSTDASGSYIDFGAVAFATIEMLSVEAFVPPHLTFCSGITVALDCSAAEGFYINLGELSKTSPNTNTSQYSGATNDPAGYSVAVLGNTMMAGNNVIPPLGAPTPSSPGTSQFGINLRANSSPAVGQDPSGPGTAVPSPGYNIPNRFMFQPGSNIASSSLPTEFSHFTVSYLVNVSDGQSPGIYNATLTFLAVAAF